MSSKIEWTNETWNPITGCTPVSEGCQRCYAKRMAQRLAGRFGYPKRPDEFKVTLHGDKINQPLKWRKPRMVFVCSMGDLFHEDVPDGLIDMVFTVMAVLNQHTFQVLTKRPERMNKFLEDARWREVGNPGSPDVWSFGDTWPFENAREQYREKYKCELPFPEWPLSNVWLGITAENQQRWDERVPILLDTPAAVRFVSCEPMLSPVVMPKYIRLPHPVVSEIPIGPRVGAGPGIHKVYLNPRGARSVMSTMPVGAEPKMLGIKPDECEDLGLGINWLICGGETGPGARPMHPDWARSLRDQTRQAGVPFFMKQMSRKEPIPDDLMIREYPTIGR